MAAGKLHAAVAHLRQVGLMPDGAGISDDQLLQRFLDSHDEIAFACLVRRHGPMVMAVCQRTLRNRHDAEDAFQATFLVLARKAGSVRKGVLPAWLYGVAYRTALGGRTAERRRRAKERNMFRPEATQPDPWQDWRELLDQELAALPEEYRAAIVLCDLQGKSRKDAARQLGWKEGTLSGRLARGRALLARRMSPHDPALFAGGVTALLAQQPASAAVSPALIFATTRAAGATAAGCAAAVSAKVTFLTEGALKAMATAKLKLALLVAFFGLALAAAGLLADQEPTPGVPSKTRKDRSGRVIVQGQAAARVAPQEKREPFHPFHADARLQRAITYAVGFLKQAQKDNRAWDADQPGVAIPGGGTSLALLALLKSGVLPADPAVAKGLRYLRGVKPDHTYVVSLQTAVFAHAEPKRDLNLVKRNATWILDTMQRKEGKFEGWSYGRQALPLGDNSNTQFAVMALHEAQQAGVKIEPKVWKEIQKYYLETQTADGGWCYQPRRTDLPPTLTMTSGGLSGLMITAKHLNKTAEIKKAIDKAKREVGLKFRIDLPQATFYSLYGLARAGRHLGTREFVGNDKHDWFREGAEYLLQTQRDDGSWRAEGLALLFCAEGK
jgi:RNA polymerase sigma factor (sigma-70 family)